MSRVGVGGAVGVGAGHVAQHVGACGVYSGGSNATDTSIVAVVPNFTRTLLLALVLPLLLLLTVVLL